MSPRSNRFPRKKEPRANAFRGAPAPPWARSGARPRNSRRAPGSVSTAPVTTAVLLSLLDSPVRSTWRRRDALLKTAPIKHRRGRCGLENGGGSHRCPAGEAIG
eukprot:3934484-Pleurochrysis_carterae.AAC.1